MVHESFSTSFYVRNPDVTYATRGKSIALAKYATLSNEQKEQLHQLQG
jgi:hypothetical protein